VELEIKGERKDEKMVGGDMGIAADDRWLHSNIFQSTRTIKNKVWKFWIDVGSCENIVYTKALSKLALVTE
jgi:hypothetical protein